MIQNEATTPKFTRADYMEKRCTHRQYYAQFVTRGIKQTVLRAIGLDRLMRSTDPHFNDIPLANWDCIHRRHDAMATSFVIQEGEGRYDNSLNAGTCIVKEAARQIVEEETELREGAVPQHSVEEAGHFER